MEFISMNQMTKESKKQVNAAKRKMKKKMEEIGMSTIRNRITAEKSIEIDAQLLEGGIYYVTEKLVEKNIPNMNEILDGVKEYREWTKNWKSDGVSQVIMVNPEGHSVTLFNKSQSGIPFYTFNKVLASEQELQRVEKIVEKYIGTDLMNEVRLKMLFDGGPSDRVTKIKNMVLKIDKIKNQRLKSLENEISRQVKSIVTEYEQDIKAIDIQLVEKENEK